MRWLLPLLLALVATFAQAETLPKGAVEHLPVLVQVQQQIWPDAPMPSFLAAQVEKESCITLKHSRCWNPRAELKTSREYGFGFGQTTIAYRADGSVRFNKQAELRKAHASLRDWTWERRYDPRLQLIALVEMDKGIWARQRDAATELDRLKFTLSAYNGGEGGLLQDRRMCANTKGCDPSRWSGHVEHTSLKAKVAKPGYGKSFFQINREYVVTILGPRRMKYESYFTTGQGAQHGY